MQWQIDTAHSSVTAAVKHMMLTTVRGTFAGTSGVIDFDPATPEAASIELRIPATSVNTGDQKRDAHLRSADFLDAATYPEIVFRSASVTRTGKDTFAVDGDLTIRGVTRPATLDVRYLGQWQTPWWENGVDKGPKTRAGFLATTRINRKDFGVNWSGTLDRGGLVVSDDVDITIDVEAIRED